MYDCCIFMPFFLDTTWEESDNSCLPKGHIYDIKKWLSTFLSLSSMPKRKMIAIITEAHLIVVDIFLYILMNIDFKDKSLWYFIKLRMIKELNSGKCGYRDLVLPHHHSLWVVNISFNWSLSDSKSPYVSRTPWYFKLISTILWSGFFL